MFRFLVLGRALADGLLTLAGVFNVAAILRPRSRRKTIAFQAYSPHLAQCFAPIIARLQRDHPDIEIHFIVLSHPHFSLRSMLTLRDFAHHSLGVARSSIHFFWQVLWRQYDLLVCTDVYARFPIRHCKKVLLKHGAGVAHRILKPHLLRKTVYDFDLVLVNGEIDYELLRRCCPENFIRNKVFAAGLPYLDRLQTCEESRDAYLRRIGHRPDRKVALVAPSWRGLQMIQDAHPEYLNEILKALKELEWQVIIKLHACSFNKAMVRGRRWKADIGKYLLNGVRADPDIDDIPALLHSDLLITDISSRAFNFMLLGKPVIAVAPDDLFTENLDRERVQLMRQSVFVVRSPDEIKTIIRDRLHTFDFAQAERGLLVSRIFANPGRAAEAVAYHLLRGMDGTAGGR